MSRSNRAPSPYRSGPSPGAPGGLALPSGPATVGPGAVTYAKEAGPDGSTIYQPYRAVAASYNTPGGLVSGIQWVKADPESLVSQGIDPIAWNIQQQTNAWEEKEAQHRRRDEERGSSRHQREDGRNSRNDAEELRKAREWDSQSVNPSSTHRDRRRSFSSSVGQPAFPINPQTSPGRYPVHSTNVAGGYDPYQNGVKGAAPIAYSTSAGSAHGRNPSTSSGYGEISQMMVDLELDRKKEYAERERETSHSQKHRSTETGPYERQRTVSGNYGSAYPTAPGAYPGTSSYGSMGPPTNSYQSSSQYAPSPYMRPGEMGHGSSAYAPSPQMRPGEVGYGTASPSGYPMSSSYATSPSQHPSNIGRSTTPFGNPPPVYPRGYAAEGQPMPPGPPMINNATRPRSRAPSRAPSPNPATYRQQNVSGSGKSPGMHATQIPEEMQRLPAPEAFSRPLNMANSFMPFETLKIRDMEDIFDPKLPVMPPVLVTHDIYPEDWQRCMQDLGRSWIGQLPIPKHDLPKRRSQLAADLVILWNQAFFNMRGIELLLCKGKERRTGSNSGMIDNHLPGYEDSGLQSSTGSDSEAEFAHRSPYGRDVQAEKAEKRRRRKERRAKRKARTYTIYVACLPRQAPVGYAHPPTGYAHPPTGYGASAPVSYGYGQPPGVAPMGYSNNPSYNPNPTSQTSHGHAPVIPASRSQGYGGGY